MKYLLPGLIGIVFVVVVLGQPGPRPGGGSSGGPTNGITSAEGTNIANASAKIATNALHTSDVAQFYPSNNPAGFVPSNSIGTIAFKLVTDYVLSPTNSGTDGQVPSLSGDKTKWITPSSGSGSGDMLAANNLSDVASTGQSRTNIGANNASNLSQGTVADARLSANVPLLNAQNNHSGSNSFTDIGIYGSGTVGTMVVTNAYINLASSTNLPIAGVASLSTTLAAMTNGNPISPSSITNAALTASRMVLSDANKKEISAAASGAVPINADGTATTAAQIDTLGVLAQVAASTNGNPISPSTITNAAATASTVASYDANKKLVSIANGSGYLNNDGNGALTWGNPAGGSADGNSDIGTLRQTATMFEEFLNGHLHSSVGYGVFGLIDNGAFATGVSGETNAPGILRLTLSTARSFGTVTPAGNPNYSIMTRGVLTNEWRFRMSTNNTATVGNAIEVSLGLGVSTGVPADNDGFALYFSTNNANFCYVSKLAGATVTNATTLVPTPNQWYKFRAVFTANASTTNIVCTIDGAQSYTVPMANCPKIGLQPVMEFFKINGAAAQTLDIDYLYIGYTLEATR